MSTNSMIGVAIVMIVIITITESVEWNYKPDSPYGAHRWSDVYPQYCDPSQNSRQSPIDIKLGSLKYDLSLTPLELDNYKSEDVTFSIMNNGHTVQCTVLEGRMTTKGRPVDDDEYEVLQFHFHWGSETRGGSEHTVLGKHYQAELHIVNVNTKHSKLPFSEIIKKPDGVLALSVFIDFANEVNGKTPNAEFSKVMKAAMDVRGEAETTKNLTRGYLALDGLLPADRSAYYTYIGGVTTPPCSGATTWVIHKEPIYVNKNDLEVLYKVMDEEHEPVTNNHRPVQEIGDRIVRSSFQDVIVAGAPGLATTFTALITSLALIVFMDY